MAYDDAAKKLAVKVIGTVESDLNYGAVNYNDPITVGIAQWYGTRAAGVLNRMRTTNAAAWYGVEPSIGNQLATINQNDAWWDTRYLTQVEGNSLVGVMRRNQTIQNTQLTEDLEVYKDVAISYGFDPEANTATVLYFFSMHHQSPASALEVVQTLDTDATLQEIHDATLAHPVLGQYGSRYRTTFDLISEADVSGVDPEPPVEPEPTQTNGNARYIEQRGDLLITHFADNEKLTFYPSGPHRWTPRKSKDAPPPPTPTQPPVPPDNSTTGDWFHPAPGTALTSPYGPRSFDGFHWGADMSSTTAPTGVPIYAVTDLVVTQSYNAGGGNATAGGCVKGHTVDEAYTFCYYHMVNVTPTVGATVPAGTQIGVEGATGNVTGTHLHFEAYNGNHSDPWPPPYGDPVEPLAILRNHGVAI